jgi:hypothetical protein
MISPDTLIQTELIQPTGEANIQQYPGTLGRGLKYPVAANTDPDTIGTIHARKCTVDSM